MKRTHLFSAIAGVLIGFALSSFPLAAQHAVHAPPPAQPQNGGAAQPSGHASHQRDPKTFDEKGALAYSQAAIGRTIRDQAFVDPEGKAVRLSDFRGKPLVISMIFTSCHHTCPLITQSLKKQNAIALAALGKASYAVVSVGFDAVHDTPARMSAYRRSQGVSAANWTLLSGDEPTMKTLAEDLGFIYRPSPGGFDHLAQTTILDGSGRVFRQVYGEELTPQSFVEPLKDLVFGTQHSLASVDGILNRIRLFCTVYDAKSERYKFDYSIFLSMILGALCLGVVAVFIVRLWLKSRPGGESA